MVNFAALRTGSACEMFYTLVPFEMVTVLIQIQKKKSSFFFPFSDRTNEEDTIYFLRNIDINFLNYEVSQFIIQGLLLNTNLWCFIFVLKYHNHVYMFFSIIIIIIISYCLLDVLVAL